MSASSGPSVALTLASYLIIEFEQEVLYRCAPAQVGFGVYDVFIFSPHRLCLEQFQVGLSTELLRLTLPQRAQGTQRLYTEVSS